MTRQRKEIIKKMNLRAEMFRADKAMGDLPHSAYVEFQEDFDALEEQYAATYGLTWEEYWDRSCQISMQLVAAGIIC